jgi:hypothetical protein
MKLELRKETKIDSNVFYTIYLDDKYVDGSLSSDFEKVKKRFDFIKENGVTDVIEVLEEFNLQPKNTENENSIN